MLKKLFSAAALALAATNASAATFYTDQTAFSNATGPLSGFEDFEVAQSGATHTYSGFTLSEIGGSNFVVNHATNSLSGWNPVQAGSGAAWFDDNGDSIGRFVFSSAINALGVYVSTRPGGSVTISGGGFSTSISTSTTPTFFGVIGTSTFTTLDFAADSGPEIGWDSLSFGTAAAPAVPLPASGLLLLGAVAGLARRRKQT